MALKNSKNQNLNIIFIIKAHNNMMIMFKNQPVVYISSCVIVT